MLDTHPACTDALKSRLEHVASLCDGSLRKAAEAWPPERPAPIWTENGSWYRQPEMWTDWTPGFFAGQMWILHDLLGGDAFWRERAEAHSRSLLPRRFDRDVHDLGFVFLSSYGRWLRFLDEGDPLRTHVIDTLVTAATVQSYRWNGGGEHKFIYSFNGPQSLFIDIMMNVRLLFWATKNGASDEVLDRAMEHSRSSAKFLVRSDGPSLGDEDGSVRHEAIFNTDPGRGEFRCLSTQQGYSPFTCWSRGLAWSLYGFAYAHKMTGDAEFLEVAKRCAKFYLANTPESGVPYWDYGAPKIPEEPLDSSAAAIAGCGLLVLSQLGVSEEERASYVDCATRIVTSLTQDEFLGPVQDGEEGLLLEGVYHRPKGWGVGGAVMWGDYFFLELVERFLRAEVEGPGL